MKYYSWIVLISVFLFVYILPLNIRPLAIPDEPRYAEIPREMIANGDWVVPRLNGIRYFEKPVMGYWLTGACLKLFGERPFSVRLPAALTTGLSALALLFFVRRITGSNPTAFLASAVFLSSVEVFAVGTFAVQDAPLSLFVTLVMIFFFMAYAEPSPGLRRLFLVLCGVSCGAAFLVKGFLAFAIPCVSIIPFLIIEKRLKDVFRFGVIPFVAAVLTALPWVILVHIREPDYWRYFFWVEHVQRFLSATSGQQHEKPVWFFIPVILLGFLPWTFVVPAVVKGLRDEKENATLLKFVLCWLIFPFIMLSLSKGKLATYILPSYAPLAIMMSLGFVNCLKHTSVPAFRIGAIVSVFFGIILVGALVVGRAAGIEALNIFAANENWRFALLVGAACSWAVVSLVSAVTRFRFASLVIFAAAPLVLMIIAPFAVPDRINHDERYLPEGLLLRNVQRIHPTSHIFSDAEDAPAICWILKRNDVTIVDEAGELAYGLKHEDSKHRFISHDVLRRRIKEGIPGENILINEPEDIGKFLKSLPEPLLKDSENAFMFVQF